MKPPADAPSMRETVLMWVVVGAVAVPPLVATVVAMISVAWPLELRSTSHRPRD